MRTSYFLTKVTQAFEHAKNLLNEKIAGSKKSHN